MPDVKDTLKTSLSEEARVPAHFFKIMSSMLSGAGDLRGLNSSLASQFHPRVKLEFKNVNIEVNSTFTEKCYWSGDREIPLNWTKYGVLLSTNNILVIKGATFKDKGYYKCTAQNDYGKANASFGIDVTGKYSAQAAPDRYPTLITGDVLTLTCQVTEDIINVTWKKDGESPSERAKTYTQWDKKESELTITKVLEEDGGKYSCEGRNKLGFVARSFVKITVKGSQGSSSLWYYIGGSVAAVIVISLIACFFCRTEQEIQLEPLNVEVDEWEIEVSHVLLQEVIGRGAFGAVWRALLSSPNGRPGNQTVAAKCFTPTAGEEGRNCLMREIELRKLIDENNQPSIVRFMGCVSTQIHSILIMEYMPCNDLLRYLRKCRGVRDRYYFGDGRAQDLTNYDLVMFANFAAGMVFLGSRRIIHRDLVARNILLDNNYVCKVTDFCMAYQSFKYGHGNAKKCSNTPNKEKRIALHSIPFYGADDLEKKKFRKKWVDFVQFKRAHWKPTKYSAVCSNHFREEDYSVMFSALTSETMQRRLRKDGVGISVFPTVELRSSPSRFNSPTPTRRRRTGLKTNSSTSLLDFIRRRVGVGGIPNDGWSEGRVVAEVTKGCQMPKTDHVDKELHDMMKRCWNLNPDFRPPFENLRQRLDK
ncbi:Tyrosine kinase receptor Cad96Ca [Stylophora pistillata]|uniref:receptor protein-tyrosine kinase n=1 Tax=Stylophora pistillata TaxID=50429 RepID=A0A2B4RDY5_STYPI|nr:Tyrosine kinase receptor Cad96Ca [Stylophora pistillata]